MIIRLKISILIPDFAQNFYNIFSELIDFSFYFLYHTFNMKMKTCADVLRVYHK